MTELSFLRQAIGELRVSVNNLRNENKELSSTNHLLVITELIKLGVITKEEAMTDKKYSEFVNSLKENKTIEKTLILGKIKKY